MTKYKRNSNNEFSDIVVDLAFLSAHGKCENCEKELRKESRGNESPYGWEAHHIDQDGLGTQKNCKILCQECHKKTFSYGRH